MSDVEEFGGSTLADPDRLTDSGDNGVRPDGMQQEHQDDDEGGEGVEDPDADENDEGDRDEKSANNANKDPQNGGKKRDAAEEDEDDEEDDEEEEDEDEDDDEEEEEDEANDRPKKKKQRRFKANKYVDIEVEVDEDEDEEDEEEAGEAGFQEQDYLAAGAGGEGRRNVLIADDFEGDEGLDVNDERGHREFDRRKRDREEAEAQRMAKQYKDRHRQRRGGGIGGQAMSDFAPRSVLMPGVNDPSIWCVKCKIGRERELIMSISRKSLAQNLGITSAFQRDSFLGHLYIEARGENEVREATAGLIGVYGSTAPILIPIEEMPDLLKSRRKETPLTVGGWVRIKKGTYKGDLAQVDDVPEGNTDMVTLKVVPRIEQNPGETRDAPREGESALQAANRKRRRNESALFRPPPKFFNAEEVRAAYAGKAKVHKDAEGYHFGPDLYVNGYLIKDFRISAIERENINPTIDEITAFIGETAAASTTGADGLAAAQSGDGIIGTGEHRLDLNLVAEAAKAQTVLQPGDYVEIFEGSQKGVIGSIDSLNNNIIIISPTDPVDLIGTKIEVLATQVRKRFKPGDHIKVMRGKNANESGLVLQIKHDLVTFLSDLSVQEVTVFSKDVREAAEVGAGAANFGQYELHDLVQIDAETTGVIFKIEPETFRILDQTGAVRLLRPSQIGNKIDTRRAVAIDSEGFELQAGDQVKEVTNGMREGRTGRVLHVYRSLFAFLHNRDVVEHGGVFTCSARSLASLAPKGSRQATDLTKMNPEMAAGAASSAAMLSGMMGPPGMGGAPKREYAKGAHVTVVKGNHKGYKGIIKDLFGTSARVELHTNNKTITIPRNQLGAMGQSGQLIPLEEWERERAGRRGPGGGGMGGPGGAGGYTGSNNAPLGSRTPYGGAGNATPMSAYASGKTPMYAGGKTPFGGGYGGATPFGGSGGATPYMSGRTPAYGGGGDAFSASSRTPYVASGSGGGAFNPSSRTPFAGNAGGASGTPSWGGATPYGSSSGQSRSGSTNSWGPSPVPANGSASGPSAVQAANDAWSSSASPAWAPNPPSNSAPSLRVGGDSWGGGATPSYGSAKTPAAGGDAWGATSPMHPQHLSAPTPYASAPTPAAPTPYASAATPAAGLGANEDDDWGENGGGLSAPTPAAQAQTPAVFDDW